MSVKRKGHANYTQMTLESLRRAGCSVDKVEKFNAYAGPFGRREDAFGFIDIIALRPSDSAIVAIQSTGANGHSEHKKKILACDFAREWLQCRGKIELWSWRKILVKPGGKAMRWHPRIEEITEEMFDQCRDDNVSDVTEIQGKDTE